MPGYEPFLLCDFHVHTQWSDGKLSVSEVVDLYGSTGTFDVIAITDHILMKKDLLARAGRLATLGRRAFRVRENDFEHYIDNVRSEARRALEQYGMLVVPGAEITQNRLRGRKNSHIIALDIKNGCTRSAQRSAGSACPHEPHFHLVQLERLSTCALRTLSAWEIRMTSVSGSVTSLTYQIIDVRKLNFHTR